MFIIFYTLIKLRILYIIKISNLLYEEFYIKKKLNLFIYHIHIYIYIVFH